MTKFVETLLHLDLEGGGRALELDLWSSGLGIEVSNGFDQITFWMTDEQAHNLELALRTYRYTKPFKDRKEPDADGEPRSGAELEGRASPPLGA